MSAAAPRFSVQPYTLHGPGFAQAAALYSAVFGGAQEKARAFYEEYAAKPGHVGLNALTDAGEVVGTTFGHAFGAGNWWDGQVQGWLGAASPAVQGAWVLVELAVREDCRRAGVAGLLMDALAARVPERRWLLGTAEDNVSARRFYEQRGWAALETGAVFGPGQPPQVVYGLDRDSGGAA